MGLKKHNSIPKLFSRYGLKIFRHREFLNESENLQQHIKSF
jgi:hypothetical protein